MLAQLCSQIYHYHITGVDWQILGSEIANLTEYCSDNERHTAEDEIVRRICSVPEKTDSENYFTATQILEAILLNTPHKNLNKYNVGRSMQRAGFIPVVKRVNSKNTRGYHVKLTF